MKIKIIIPVLTLVLSSVLCSCNENGLIDYPNIIFPDSLVSFSNHVQPFLKTRCAYEGCHSDQSQAAGRRMTDWMSLFDINNINLVIPYKPDSSYISMKMDGRSPFLWYCYHGAAFNSNQINGMRRWIAEGAKNN